MYDYLIVGAGIFGATLARCLSDNNKHVLVIDRCSHIAGNIYQSASKILMFTNRGHISCILTTRKYEILSLNMLHLTIIATPLWQPSVKTWHRSDEPFYPVNDNKNNALYARYKEYAKSIPNVIFGGRLGTYRYLDMDKVIKEALNLVQELL